MRRLAARFGLHAAALLLLTALVLPAAGWAAARPRFALLQRAKVLQESGEERRSPEEKNADRAARALTQQQREAARKVRLAHIALIEQLMQMPEGERQRFLAENPRIRRMPDPQRQRIEQLTQRLSSMPEQEQALLLERYRLFLDLPPQKQQQARRIYRVWRTVEPERRRELLREVESLSDASPEARRERFASSRFRETYTVREQRILRGLTSLFP
jgi:hypothetical protein